VELAAFSSFQSSDLRLVMPILALLLMRFAAGRSGSAAENPDYQLGNLDLQSGKPNSQPRNLKS
jgi:hypothetical protein